ncbi:DNA starvation/stationary phase protection protein [Caballeronia sp. LZ043]|uniref:Dps family protein n=1 Tax=Caballeronia sp. LZ043 TaxID=3038569 RepID=UPI002864328C|nr:DNA starvation/stationary phase protection protein [Caballeronia sp. LZ043]MDR5826111.1 DNA starvation/stationary phase protection protein [Caballeronia sp. LZ043]
MLKKTDLSEDLLTPTDLGADARDAVAGGLTVLLADIFALFLKTKNFHWHVSGPHFRSLHEMFDEHAGQIFAMVDDVAERARKLGGTTLRSVGHIVGLQRIKDNDETFVTARQMLEELRLDNQQLIKAMRELHEICDDKQDIATASVIENWIDETEGRVWFLFEAARES